MILIYNINHFSHKKIDTAFKMVCGVQAIGEVLESSPWKQNRDTS